MRLLVVTQAVDADSSTLGFFVEWLREFARQCERVEVIGLSVGRHDLPPNVRVHSMGKERGVSRFARFMTYRSLLRRLLPEVDGVFFHMCPEYVIAGWPLVGRARKGSVLWYAHRADSLRLRLGATLVDRVASVAEGSTPLRGARLAYLGHGIPTDLFALADVAKAIPPRLVAVGRIAPIKRLGTLIDALAILRRKGLAATLELWGEAGPRDAAYRAELEERVRAGGLGSAVSFKGPAPYARMPEILSGASVALNACDDGALDKAVLEAMAAAVPVVVMNRRFASSLGPDADRCIAVGPEDVAARVEAMLTASDPGLGGRLRARVEEAHSLRRLVRDVLSLYHRRT